MVEIFVVVLVLFMVGLELIFVGLLFGILDSSNVSIFVG